MSLRSPSERLTEVITLIKKLDESGFNKELSGVKEFIKHANIFIKDGKRQDLVIQFTEDRKVELRVTLSSNKNVDCSVLIHNKQNKIQKH